MRAGPESNIQRAIARFLEIALPPNAVWLVFPAGDGKRVHPGTGYRAGTPDMMVVHDGRALFIEVKAPGGRISAKQGDMIQRLHEAGCTTHVVTSVEAVETALRLAGVPLRGTTGANLEAIAGRAAA